MSITRKLMSTGLTGRYKEKWLQLPIERRRELLAKLLGAERQADLRTFFFRHFKLPKLRNDSALVSLRDFAFQQDLRDKETEQVEIDRANIAKDHPDWDKEATRAELIKRIYERSLTTGDAKTGIAILREDRGWEDSKLEREKWETEVASKVLSDDLLKRARELNEADMAQADRIAAMREAMFGPVDKLVESGRIKLPPKPSQ